MRSTAAASHFSLDILKGKVNVTGILLMTHISTRMSEKRV